MKRIAVVAFTVCLVVFGAIGWNLFGRYLGWLGTVRIAADTKPEVPFDPYRFPNLLATISNAAQGEGFQNELGASSKLPRDDFAFCGVDVGRGTALIEITYAATDRAAAERISTNAGMMFLRLLRTNQSVSEIELIECEAHPRPPFWRPRVNRVERLLP